MKFSAICLVVVLIALCGQSLGAAVYSANVQAALKKGMKYLGEVSTVGVNGQNIMASYLLSQDRMNQNAAIEECRFLGGDLLYILTRDQDETIRLLTSGISEHIWTSGRYDINTRRYTWVTVNRQFNYDNPVSDPNHPPNPSPNANQGVTISTGDLSLYGWCFNSVSQINYVYRYICQFN